MQWIDTHVHLFSNNDSDHTAMPLVFGTNSLNTPDLYLEMLERQKPAAIVVVDFSKSNDSEHVVNSLDELQQKNVKAAGVIKANLNDERTMQWLARPDVKAIRIYAKESLPDLSGAKWQQVFAQLTATNKHVLVFGDGANLTTTVQNIPHNVTILIDHLGLPKLSGANEDFTQLLMIAKQRGNIYFKGPGYRTSLDVEKVKPFVRQIVQSVGANRLMLGASDAPFGGPVMEADPQYHDKKYAQLIDYKKVLQFIDQLAKDAAATPKEVEQFLYNNAKELYGF